MRTTIAAAIAIATAAAGGCGQSSAAQAQGVVSRNYNVGNFNHIAVAGPYDVQVRTGARVSVSGAGTQRLMQRTEVVVEGNKLIIRPQRERGWFNFNHWSRGEKARFTVTVPQLSGAGIGGSGNIRIDRVQGDRFDGDIGGSGSISVGSMAVRSIKLSIGGSGSISPGAGRTQSADYNIAGSGDIDAPQLQAQQLDVSIAGSGNVQARATGTAKVDIVGAGDVTITGGAKCSVHKMGSGRVNCS